jgi:hypothetical protein
MKKEVRNEDGRNAVFGTAQKTPGAKESLTIGEVWESEVG